jgi:hypothetical protein
MRRDGTLCVMVVMVFLLASSLGGVSSIAQEESPRQLITRVCSRCHALKIMGQCMAGDCRGNHVVRVLAPAPWDLVIDWMQSMGAKMTAAEQQTIRVYLQRTFPAKPYPLQWVKLPTAFGTGGWNVVSLKGYADHLYAGFEGNGKIFRSERETGWKEVANTEQYTVYGLTPFHDALYAGTNDPDPQIWKSTDGLSWTRVARLPPEDHGIISLGVFHGLLYAGTARAWIYRSPDGLRWEKAADLQQVNEASYVHWVRFLLEFHGQLYAGIERGSLYRSADGVSWSPVGPEVTADRGVRGGAIFQDRLYVGKTGGGEIWSSHDGLAWQKMFTAPPHVLRGYVASMTVVGKDLFAGIDGYVFQTRDGRSWREVGHLGPFSIEAMAPFRGALYAGTVMPPSGHLYVARVDQVQ